VSFFDLAKPGNPGFDSGEARSKASSKASGFAQISKNYLLMN
jgi:hypothetical protein